MIHYIVAMYTGERKNRVVNDLLKDPTYMAKEQINALTTLNLPDIKKVTFVISPSKSPERDNTLLNFILDQRENLNKYTLNAFIAPNNDNHSYGAWNFCMNDCMNSKDHLDFFLIEDDYLPAKDEFYLPFYQEMKGNKTAYVCQFYDRGAAISNGLMPFNSARFHHKNFGNCINVESQDAMMKTGTFHKIQNDPGVYSQIHFLAKFQKHKFHMGHVAEKYCQPFFDRLANIIMYGNIKKEVLIKPVTYDESKRSTYRISKRAYR